MSNAYNWSEALKVEVGDLTQAPKTVEKSPLAPIPEGRYAAFVQEIKHGTFKKGSYGVTVTYVIEGGVAKNRKLREYVVLLDASKNPTKYGNVKLKRRLMSFGLPIEKINAFKAPKSEHDLGDFRLAISAPVTILVKEDAAFEGRPTRRVAAVYPRLAD